MLYLLWLLASGAVRTIAVSPTPTPTPTTSCFDTAHGATDLDGDGCAWYDGNPSDCGYFDDDDFSSKTMCCACAGGTTTPPTTNGDPITMFHGKQMRYWLSAEHFTPVFEQGPLILSQLAGPANPPPGLEEQKGAWVVATELNLAGLDKIRIEVVDPTTLLAPPNATAATTAAADALTTMRLSFGGKQLAAGEHTLSVLGMPASVTAARVDQKHKIGSGFVDEIHIKAQGLHLRISSSVANKFADEKLQVLGLHLDLEFLTFDQAKVRGALPEMWGLQPMSEGTKLLLDKKNVDN